MVLLLAAAVGCTPTPAQLEPQARAPGSEDVSAESDGTGQAKARGSEGSGRSKREHDLAAVLRRQLAGLVVDDDRKALRILEFHGAGTPPRSPSSIDELVDLLGQAVNNDRAAVRRGALAVLRRMDPRTMPLGADWFSSGLMDGDPSVRRQAVLGLLRHASSAARLALLDLSEDPDSGVRAAVAGALNPASSERARARLLALLRDPADEVVLAAADALSRGLSGVPPQEVLTAARSERACERIAAVRVLGALGADGALVTLANLGSDEDWTVRREAILAMAQLRGPLARLAEETLQGISIDPQRSRTDRFEALQHLARTARTPELIRVFDVAVLDEDPVLRLAASRTLLAHGDPRGLQTLVPLLEVQESDHADDEDCDFVRATAAATLREVCPRNPGDDNSVAGWQRLMSDILAELPPGSFKYQPPLIDQFW